MTKISFEKETKIAELLDPTNKFKLTKNPIEFRKDPLTGNKCRINVKRAKREKQVENKSDKDLKKLLKGSEENCFFCPNNIKKKTPKFPEYFPSERLESGSARIFPNLFPFGEFHAVGVFSEDHFLLPNQFNPKMLENCFDISLQYIRFVHEVHPPIKHCSINWNFLPPAAASIVHPHLQVLVDRNPTFKEKELTAKSKEYLEEKNSNYWYDLIEEEKEKGERWIGETGSISWMTSFAPQGKKEVLGIFPESVSNATQINKDQLEDFCVGLSKILKSYHEIGVESFNLTMFSGPLNKDTSDYYRLNVKLISRPRLEPFYTSDGGFMEKLHNEPILETMPENLAERIRNSFF